MNGQQLTSCSYYKMPVTIVKISVLVASSKVKNLKIFLQILNTCK